MLLLAAVVVAVIGTTCRQASSPDRPSFRPDFDPDDRPPIIVYSGSTHLMAMPIDGLPGEWKDQGSGRHDHVMSNKDPVQMYIVHLTGSTTCSRGKYPNIKSLKIESSTGPDVTIQILNGNASASASDGSAPTSTYEGTISFGGASSYIKKITLSKQGGNPTECAFDATHPPRMMIEQKVK